MNNKFDEDFDETKRKSLIKMGKSAVYVAPAVLTLLTSQKASAMSVPAGGGRRRKRPWWKFW